MSADDPTTPTSPFLIMAGFSKDIERLKTRIAELSINLTEANISIDMLRAKLSESEERIRSIEAFLVL